MSGGSMDDVVGRFCTAVEAGDVDGVLATLGVEAELVSPLVGRAVIRGRDDLRVLFSALLPILSPLTWRHRVGVGDPAVVVAESRVAGVRIGDAILVELDGEGYIRRMTPHVRPWLGSTMLAVVLGPKLIRHPAVLRRALRPVRDTSRR